MMMKLTVAFLATLAAADAAQAHGRRHVRRAPQDYGYGGYGGAESSGVSSAAFPLGTGSPSSVIVETPAVSSTALPVEAPSSSVPSVTGGFEYPHGPAGPSGTAPGVPGPSGEVPGPSGYPVGGPSGSAGVPGPSGHPVGGPSGYPVGGPSSVVVESVSPSSGVPALPLTTAAPVESIPYPSGTGVAFPVTGVANTTAAPGEGEYIVTSTIYSTQIFTLTVTVPGEADATKLITSVVPIATSICTKTSGVPDTVTAPVATAPVSEVVHVTTATLTYTIGVGSTAHPVTTEIVQTSTETIYKTIVVTQPAAPVSSVEAVGSVVPIETPTGTTVISSTSTTTKFVTVYPTPASSGYPVGAEGSVVPVPAGASGECAPPLTETVTVKETVYVTAGYEAPATSALPADVTSAVVPGVPTGAPVPSAPFPFPASNGTVAGPAPTGFLTQTKPVEATNVVPYPTGPAPAVTAPSGTAPGTEYPTAVPGTSGLPVFSLPASEGSVPSSTALPVEVPSSSAAVEYPAYPVASSTAAAAAVSSAAVEYPAYPVASSTAAAVESSAAATPTPAAGGDYGYGSYRKARRN
jgi:hypothetical protein